MVRNPVSGFQAEEVAQRQRVRASPFDPALAVDPLEIPDQVHPKVPARRHRGRAYRAGVVRLAGVLDEAVVVSSNSLSRLPAWLFPGARPEPAATRPDCIRVPGPRGT